jgi:hypothetical protein
MARGDLCGEISLLTGKTVSATVTAVTDVQAAEVDQSKLTELATQHPGIYRNLCCVLAERVLRSDIRGAHLPLGTLITVMDHGSPPELPFALACSIAWHTRAKTDLLAQQPPGPFGPSSFATSPDPLGAERIDGVGVHARASREVLQDRSQVTGLRIPANRRGRQRPSDNGRNRTS